MGWKAWGYITVQWNEFIALNPLRIDAASLLYWSLFEMSKQFRSMHYCSQRLYIWSLTGHARQDSSSQSLQCLHIHIQKHHLQSVTVMYVVNLAVSHFIVYQSKPFIHHTLLNPVWRENDRPWWILLAYFWEKISWQCSNLNWNGKLFTLPNSSFGRRWGLAW